MQAGREGEYTLQKVLDVTGGLLIHVESNEIKSHV